MLSEIVKFFKENTRTLLFAALFFANIIIWIHARGIETVKYVEVDFLNVGQGDAILIEATNHNQVLIDAGPNRAVLRELGREMPWFDRTIDVVIATHPDRDHIGGLPEIVRRYEIGTYIESGVASETSVYGELERVIKENHIPNLVARRGMVIDMADGSYLEILFPDRDVSGLDPNDASVIARYVYGETCFLFTGDSPQKIEEYLVSFGDGLNCEVLKAGHHGSRTSTGEVFASAVLPDYAVISSGKDNSYGHPHEDVLMNLASIGAVILNTAESGTVRFVSDGISVRTK
jgi:competence protein ComEC